MIDPTLEEAFEAVRRLIDRAHRQAAAIDESRRRAREWVEAYEAERKAKRAERQKRRAAK